MVYTTMDFFMLLRLSNLKSILVGNIFFIKCDRFCDDYEITIDEIKSIRILIFRRHPQIQLTSLQIWLPPNV